MEEGRLWIASHEEARHSITGSGLDLGAKTRWVWVDGQSVIPFNDIEP